MSFTSLFRFLFFYFLLIPIALLYRFDFFSIIFFLCLRLLFTLFLLIHILTKSLTRNIFFRLLISFLFNLLSFDLVNMFLGVLLLFLLLTVTGHDFSYVVVLLDRIDTVPFLLDHTLDSIRSRRRVFVVDLRTEVFGEVLEHYLQLMLCPFVLISLFFSLLVHHIFLRFTDYPLLIALVIHSFT